MNRAMTAFVALVLVALVVMATQAFGKHVSDIIGAGFLLTTLALVVYLIAKDPL